MDIIDLHGSMVRNVFLNVELMLNDGVKELSEYDLQGLMFLYFRRHKSVRAAREANNRVDCVLYDDKDAPKVFYELKTYFKKHEKLKKKHFDDDLAKLAKLIQERPNTRGFLFIAGAKAKFTENSLRDFSFINECLMQKKRAWVRYKLGDSTVRLRPSQKQIHGRSTVITWEVKP